ncbi:MAG TPA: endolytic transglycosylase MltG [Longimicrobium sp.]|jgi:UPF0755 protein
MTRSIALVALVVLTAACGGGGPSGPPVRFTVPPGSGLSVVADTLAAREIVSSASRFKIYARTRRAAARIQPGVYEVRRGTGFSEILRKLTTGDVVKTRVVIPEGWTVQQIGPRLAAAAGIPADSALKLLQGEDAAKRRKVPGPTLEGYLYPATYVFPLGTSVDRMVDAMVSRYRRAWTPAMRARAQALGLDEREVVTLASIVEREAKVWSERPTIAAVYHNRLKKGMRLEADPTVQYALGGNRARLLYRDIDSVADNPYNTYRHAGLPPGPIASPSTGAIQATLQPAAGDFLFFVARPNGTHVFTRTLAEHNAAKRASQAEARARAR